MRASRFRRLPLVPLLATLMLMTSVGCAEKGEPGNDSVTELTEPRQALSEELMVALSQAKNFHHKADVHLKDAQLDLAIDSLKRILEIPFPKDAAEALDVVLDARARLAKLLITRGDLEAAMTVANNGLSSSERESFFLANLYTVRGQIWEARALRADEGGDLEGGKKARKSAIVDLNRSITINSAVLKRIATEAK